MVFRRRHPASPRRLAWLLALALLLPLAQSVAAWHALTHANFAGQAADSSATTIKTAPHCDLCLTAAALGGGALPSAPLLVADFAGGHRLVIAAHVFEGAARPSHYLSRAPPFASA